MEEKISERGNRVKVGQISGIKRKQVCWKSNKIGLSCDISKGIAFGTEMMHGLIKLTADETLLLSLGFFLWVWDFLRVWVFFFRKERRHLGIQGYLSLLRKMLFGKLYVSSSKISIRH